MSGVWPSGRQSNFVAGKQATVEATSGGGGHIKWLVEL